jgi:hypothetical protein
VNKKGGITNSDISVNWSCASSVRDTCACYTLQRSIAKYKFTIYSKSNTTRGAYEARPRKLYPAAFGRS